MLRALRVLEQERGTARLHGAVDDLRDLEVGIDLRAHADELALALEEIDPFTEVADHRRGVSACAGPASARARRSRSPRERCSPWRASSARFACPLRPRSMRAAKASRRNLPQATRVRAQRPVDGVVAGRRAGSGVERSGIAVQAEGTAGLVELPPGAEQRGG